MHGPEKVVRAVFLARPAELHRLAWQGHRHLRGQRHVVHLQAPAKAATQQGDVYFHLRQWQAGRLGCRFARGLGHLAGHPQAELAVLQPGGAVHGLHGRVAQVGRAVGGAERVRRRCGRAALVEGVALFLGQLGLQLLCGLLGVERALGALCPLHLQRLGALAGMPSGFADHRQAGAGAVLGLERDDFEHARHGQCGRVVHRLHAAADHGAQAHGGKNHMRQAYIQPEGGATAALSPQVCARCGGADQRPVFARFGADAAGVELGRRCRKFAEVAFFARAVDDLALLEFNLLDG